MSAGQAQGQQVGRPRSGAEGSVPRRFYKGVPLGPPRPEDQPGATDSITLGQLKAHTEGLQKQKLYDFRYDDTDTIMTELDEFYAYSEMTLVAKLPSHFAGSFDGEWTGASLRDRKRYVELQLNKLESPVDETRRAAQGRLLYLLQETRSPEMQLHWIMENAKLVRSVDGVATLVFGLRDAARRFDMMCGDEPGSHFDEPRPRDKHEDPSKQPYDDGRNEFMNMLAMLYFMVEVFRADDTFGDELMAMEQPLPLMLFTMLAGLKDRLTGSYPVKKVLLLLWKTMLACLGGVREAAKAKALTRELAGMGPEKKDFTKASPMDIANWRRDTSTKYPTFAPGPSQAGGVPVPTDKLADGVRPIPARPNYHSTEIPVPAQSSTPAPGPPLMLPGTPAPSPPPSPAPKPKKQQFQTDPTRPFVFPYSATSGAPATLVPYAIAEADRLYHEHAFVSLGLYQLWQAREECMREERGLGKSGLIGFADLSLDDGEDAEMEEAVLREWKYEEEEEECAARGDKEGARLAREKRAASKRLRRVEVIYKTTLPIMQSWVIVLLKLLLATVSNGSVPPHAIIPGRASPTGEAPVPQADVPPPSKEEIDLERHREVLAKAVSGTLVLLCKWFKASHILKFHFLAQLLVDSNCLLLVLKMFGVQEAWTNVAVKNDIEEMNFFRYCHLQYSPAAAKSGRPSSPLVSRSPTKVAKAADGGDEVELITDYSWRNFFTTINFCKVLQKITKGRVHRVLLMCQYKSTTILKRMLRINQPMLQLQVLKVIKSQTPYCGRKWRGTNMKVITAIYLNCRPELRDDWLAGVEVDLEMEDLHVGRPQELALRSLIVFYNKSYHAGPLPSPLEKRSDSVADMGFGDAGLPAPIRGHMRHASIDADVFPPKRSAADAPAALAYNPDGMIEFWMHEYEAVLGEVFGSPADDYGGLDDDGFGVGGSGGPAARVPGAATRDDAAWTRLGEIMRARGGDDDDAISDSESVVTVGELGEDAQMPGGEEGRQMFMAMQERQRRKSTDNENTWEHMSPTTLSLLPRSPSARRRSSSGGSPLRPVMPRPDLAADVFDDGAEPALGPMPIQRETSDEREREFGAVDEVEYAYGE